jgi:quercetin dioxygenase-like cupin family protein
VNYKIDFAELKWNFPIQWVRQKCLTHNGQKLRVVEYLQDMEPHWCNKGHAGYLLDGKMEIEFENEKIVFNKGDGIFIPDGDEHKHKAKILSDKCVVFFVEKE